jgi:hypothetical protein
MGLTVRMRWIKWCDNSTAQAENEKRASQAAERSAVSWQREKKNKTTNKNQQTVTRACVRIHARKLATLTDTSWERCRSVKSNNVACSREGPAAWSATTTCEASAVAVWCLVVPRASGVGVIELSDCARLCFDRHRTVQAPSDNLASRLRSEAFANAYDGLELTGAGRGELGVRGGADRSRELNGWKNPSRVS